MKHLIIYFLVQVIFIYQKVTLFWQTVKIKNSRNGLQDKLVKSWFLFGCVLWYIDPCGLFNTKS